jgi:hypothetical protein
LWGFPKITLNVLPSSSFILNTEGPLRATINKVVEDKATKLFNHPSVGFTRCGVDLLIDENRIKRKVYVEEKLHKIILNQSKWKIAKSLL